MLQRRLAVDYASQPKTDRMMNVIELGIYQNRVNLGVERTAYTVARHGLKLSYEFDLELGNGEKVRN